jgi:hypothetical protein
MAPKAKPKAKAAAESQPKAAGEAKPKAKAASGGDALADQVPVPPPPPTPVIIRFPNSFSENAASRCVLLTWRDPALMYKLQMRHFNGQEQDFSEGWEDVQEVEQKRIGSRQDVFFIPNL